MLVTYTILSMRHISLKQTALSLIYFIIFGTTSSLSSRFSTDQTSKLQYSNHEMFVSQKNYCLKIIHEVSGVWFLKAFQH